MKSVLKAIDTHSTRTANCPRQLPFAKAKNFRDLGGYPTVDGRTVRWGVVYRSDSLHKLTENDQHLLLSLKVSRVFDFRAKHEIERRPDILPEDIDLVNIPMEDASTKVWHEAQGEMIKNMKTLDPAKYMIETNIELATKFTPGYRHFYKKLLTSNGIPILFHCAAGKDRTGFAAATLLRILGVPQDVAMQDYLLTNRYFLEAYSWRLRLMGVLKGRKFADGVRGFMRADERYLSAAFETIEREHGSFENYVRDGLELNERDIERLKKFYLE